jgi:ataxia telangiectasia mutated family protein
LCPSHPEGNNAFHVLDTGRFQSTRKLILELTAPKLSDLVQNWKRYNEDRSSAVSKDTFRRTIDACITLLLLMPQYADTASPQLHSFQADLQSLIEELLNFLNDSATRDSRASQTLIETLLQSVQPYLPPCGSNELAQISHQTPDLQKFLVQVADVLDRRRLIPESAPAGDGYDMMDLDDDFGTQQSNGRTEGQKAIMPRYDLALDTGSGSFYMNAACRLMLLGAINDTPGLSGYIPTTFIDQLLSMTEEEFLSCRGLLRELLSSDLTINEEDATQLVQYLGEKFLQSNEYNRCEIALGICLDVLLGLGSLWVGIDGSDLAKFASDLYEWFITKALPNDIASSAVLKGIARLLLLLLRIDDEDKSALPSPSPRTSLFHILQKGSVSVQFYVGNQLPDIFELFTLKAHDEVFVDLLKNLPSDPERIEGIAFRLFVLAKLASRWPTLLRRCIYHIFETPGRIKDCVDHAARCVSNVSSELKVDNTRELFQLFAPQLLYTWLESEPIEDMPFKIFGFQSLKDLLTIAQEEATALMIMRGQDSGADGLSEILGLTEVDLLQRSFTKVIAYSIAHDTYLNSSSTPTKPVPSETRVRNCLGDDIFFECVNLHFADIVALLFNTIDHGDVEKHFKKQTGFAYAAQIMEEIKGMSSSKVALPPNQQPTFRVKYLTSAIRRLCSKTEHEPTSLFTPTLVTSIARKILGTIHPALGSLHACSVLRKLRILISLSGEAAIKGYPLEMLLHSVRPFITDPECADDAIGIVQYLITRGSTHLLESPSFVAGIALSIFGSLRVFLQSTPASTTQESQYQETMSKAQRFHAWMGNYVNNYNTPALTAQSKSSFRALVQSAFKIGSIGNADISTAESDLLFRLLEDEKIGGSLLSRPSRELAFQMLCSDFQVPVSFRTDLLGSDDLAIENAAVVWKSCRGESASKQYLSWAARVLGRAFAASGHIHEELLQESTLSQIKELGTSLNAEGSSESCVLGLLQTMTLGHDRRTAGLAEVALRVIVTDADDDLMQICQRVLPPTLSIASNWPPYLTPPSDTMHRQPVDAVDEPFANDAILKLFWVRDLAIFLARSVPDDPLLPTLVPILREIPKFADRVFPYILHLVLATPSQGQHSIKQKLSNAFTAWFCESKSVAKDNLKMVINSLLYLRTQSLPNEKSSADRSHWLDIDYLKAATAARNCGMFKTALLFTEEFCSESGPSKSSRRSSAIHELPEMPTEILLTIFENIDDPDLYYGVPQDSSLSAIQARLDYEKDGPKSLAFRGAQYDSHVRSRAPESAKDVQSLVNALDVLSLSGLSHSLLQAQATVGMSSKSLESMFRTARKLEQWDIPVPSTRSTNSVTIYKAFQAVNTAPDYPTILRAIDEGLDCTMESLVREDLSASALHGSLQTLAALVEMDEVLSSQGSEQFEEMVARFRGRENWMKIGR